MCPPAEGFGDESGIGCAAVPLAHAPEIHRRILINKEPAVSVYRRFGLSKEVAARITVLLRRHGLPSRDRLVVLAANYPDRAPVDIARAFNLTVDQVLDILVRTPEIRAAEPLSTEMWEDIDEDDVTPAEIRRRAQEVRRRNELVKRQVPQGPSRRAQGGAGLGGPSQIRRVGRRTRKEGGVTKP